MTEADEGAPCEVCRVAPARKKDLLCPACSRAFILMLELLHNHPELAAEDLQRIKDVFEWRMSKYTGKVGPIAPPA